MYATCQSDCAGLAQALLPASAKFPDSEARNQRVAVDCGAAELLAACIATGPDADEHLRAAAALTLVQLFTFGPDAERLSEVG